MDIVKFYDVRAAELGALYEQVDPEALHKDFLSLLPEGNDRLALDVGAGSGRDAAWLAACGFEVVAVEPATAMRNAARVRHGSPRIRWLDDRLPELAATHRLGLSFDVVLLSAVWMHVPPGDRPRAFRKLATLVKPGGLLLMSLRDGPDDPDRPMWPAPVGEVEALARAHGLGVVRIAASEDRLGRPDVHWTTLCLRLPDDGAGALPLIRGVILNDRKSSTYKLALLRAIARIADVAPAFTRLRREGDVVDLPFGLVALFWVRMYLPLVAAGMPQAPRNEGPVGLGFAGQGFRALLAHGVVGQDLRVGARFVGPRAEALALALREARDLITRMPATYTTYPNSEERVFEASPARPSRPTGELAVDEAFLWTFGAFSVPGPVWRSLQRLGAWVEPVLVSEWTRLIRDYGRAMNRSFAIEAVQAALTWLDPVRDTSLARGVATRLIATGVPIACVWTGAPLGRIGASFDIDHCFPWSAWPCGDLWNLMPATRQVNQRLKRDRLPSSDTLSAARDAIVDWWETAWLADEMLGPRFRQECAAALPVGTEADMDEIFDGLAWRRLRLRQDQQVPEWVRRPETLRDPARA